jgi:hypothetical protein
MASPPRDFNASREEDRRLNMRTLVIASVASATAAGVTSQLWIHGTWIAAALTPALVALISEAMHRPTQRIARVWTSERPALGAGAARSSEPVAPPGEPGPVRVYRQRTARPAKRHLAIGAVAATAAIAFVVAVVAITGADLIAGDSIGKGSGSSTLFGGGGTSNKQQDSAPEQPAPQKQTPTEETPPADEPAPEQPPADTVPTTPDSPPPGEPLPDQLPSP